MEPVIDFLARHPLLVTALIVVLVVFIGNEIVVALRSGHKLSPADAVRLINDRDPLIVDVRSVSDYRKGHIIGAVNLPLARIAEADSELGKHKSRPLLIYCALGTAAGSAREKLLKAGFSEVFPLRGGLNAWQGANLPVTKGDGRGKATTKSAAKGEARKSASKSASKSSGQAAGSSKPAKSGSKSA